MVTQPPDSDAMIAGNMESLVASVSATIQFSLRMTKQRGGADKLTSPEGSDFFLGYVAGFSDGLVQAAGGQASGTASLALAERALVKLFGAEGAKSLYATVQGAMSRKFARTPAFESGLAAGASDARQIVTDKESTSVGKSFVAWYAPGSQASS